MKKFLIPLVVFALLAGAYVWLSQRHAPPPAPPPPPSAPKITEKTITEKTDNYTIDATYPQFGIASIDSHIVSIVQSALAQFKKDALDAADVPTAATYEFDAEYANTYIGEDVVSARLTISTYLGGAHPLSTAYGLNFDRATGKMLTEDDALKLVGLSLSQVAAESLKKMKAKHGDALFTERLQAKPDNFETFVVTQNSVTFIFQLYQVAAYAAGFQEVTFPRKK